MESPGLLLPGLTIEDMKLGISQIRNPVIARVFRELELVEQWGSGIPGIFRQAKTENLPEPVIEELAGRVRLTVPLPKILPLTREQSRKPEPAQSGAQSIKALLALSDRPLSTQEIARILEMDNKSEALQRSLKELLDAALIEYTLPEKPNSRLQKYRLTERGRRVVASSQLTSKPPQTRGEARKEDAGTDKSET